jgi:hypothetical protein
LLRSAGSQASLRHQENIDQLAQCGVRALADIIELHCADRMLDDQHRMIRRAKRILFRFGQRVKRVRNQGNRKPAALLNFE